MTMQQVASLHYKPWAAAPSPIQLATDPSLRQCVAQCVAQLSIDVTAAMEAAALHEMWPAAPGACLVCLDAAPDAVLVECGHGGLCAGASLRRP